MIDTNDLEALVYFADTGSLTKASELLYTSQPALTRNMHRLEQELGVSLFNRSKNHLELNETGKVAVEQARHVLADLTNLSNTVKTFDRSLHTISVAYCAPVPQSVLSPIINNTYAGMTISYDLNDDIDFLNKLKNRTYQLVCTHYLPKGDEFYYKKCGHEELFLSVKPSNPLSFYPQVHLKDLTGKTMLLFTRIGFWYEMTLKENEKIHFLLQIDRPSFEELRQNSDYPSFTSSYFIKRNNTAKNRINIPLADDSCKVDYYLVCLKDEKKRFEKLFNNINEKTID